eukprot:15339247-Alexandrium_andersonii.AAC.1
MSSPQAFGGAPAPCPERPPAGVRRDDGPVVITCPACGHCHARLSEPTRVSGGQPPPVSSGPEWEGAATASQP